jgi:hypothetical protein
MKKCEKAPVAQGDVLFVPVSELPVNAQPATDTGRIVVAHSETGHHHAIDDDGVVRFEVGDPLCCYLRVDGLHADVVHHRSFDTHPTVRLFGHGGLYQVKRQREQTPRGWERVHD